MCHDQSISEAHDSYLARVKSVFVMMPNKSVLYGVTDDETSDYTIVVIYKFHYPI